MVERYGNPVLLKRGLKVFTTMDSERQRAAQDAVLGRPARGGQAPGLPRPGDAARPPSERKAFLEKAKKVMGEEQLDRTTLYVGLVTGDRRRRPGADVQVGPHKGVLPLLGMRWARKVNPEGYYPGAMLTSVKKRAEVGDVIVVRSRGEEGPHRRPRAVRQEARRRPSPRGRAALPAGAGAGAAGRAGLHRSRTASTWSAMVGGYDFDANEYNRAFQACRQPGSSLQAAGVLGGAGAADWTEATVIVDSPIVEDDPEQPGALEAGELQRGVHGRRAAAHRAGELDEHPRGEDVHRGGREEHGGLGEEAGPRPRR